MSELSDLTIEVSNRDQTGRQANKSFGHPEGFQLFFTEKIRISPFLWTIVH